MGLGLDKDGDPTAQLTVGEAQMFSFPLPGGPAAQNPDKFCTPSFSSPRSTSPTLIPFPYSTRLLSQLRSPFPLSSFPSSPFPQQPAFKSPPSALRFPCPLTPRTQPTAEVAGQRFPLALGHPFCPEISPPPPHVFAS